jgi:uncharacterized protein RhaS with RHS repeats
LIHYPLRDLDPNLERWTTPDPIGEAGGVNLYGFVANNPLGLVDPSGLQQVAPVPVVSPPPLVVLPPPGTVPSNIIPFPGTGAGAATGTGLGVAGGAGLFALAYQGGYLLGTALGVGRDAERNPTGVNGPPATVTLPLPTGYVLGPGEQRDPNTGNILDSGGNIVRDKNGRSVGPAAKCKITPKALKHIDDRHGPSSKALGAGKFAPGTTDADIANMINQAVANAAPIPNTLGRPGQIFDLDLGSTIGTDINGNPTSILRVAVNAAGEVITAFPR